MPIAHKQLASSRSMFRARRMGTQRVASSSAAGSYPSRAPMAIRYIAAASATALALAGASTSKPAVPSRRSSVSAHECRLPVQEHRRVMTCVALAGIRFLDGRQAQLLGRVLPQQLVQLEAAEVRTAQERLRDEFGEKTQVGTRHRNGRAAVEAAV